MRQGALRKHLRKHRCKHRKAIAAQIIDDFDPKFSLIVHWDGKLVPELVGTEAFERLPVIVTRNGQSQYLLYQTYNVGQEKHKLRQSLLC